jgi:FMN reductase
LNSAFGPAEALMKIVGIVGSPSAESRSACLLEHVRSLLQPVASSFHLIAVRELPPSALLLGRAEHPAIRDAAAVLAAADVVVVATPIYKTAYSGLLKSFLDLLPADALRGKTVLPMASGGSASHLLALEYALKPVLAALGARDVLDAVYATDAQLQRHDAPGHLPSSEVRERIALSLRPLLERADEFARRDEAARERDALLARVHPPLSHKEIQ